MKVIKVVVDELPKDCPDCDWSNIGDCFLVGRQHDCNCYDRRPDWCPLITQQELLRRVASPFNDWDDSEDK
jgi:hypothetical protein